MTIVDEGVRAEPPSRRLRPWWFFPALAGVAFGAALGALVPSIGVVPRSQTSTAPVVFAQGTAQPTATRPSDLPMLPEEQIVVDHLKAIGVSAEVVGASHFERALGPALGARVFNLPGYGGADVLFLNSPRDIRVCATATTPGRLVYRIYVDGRETSSNDAGQFVAYLVSPQFFIIAWDERAASMFQLGLGVTRAAC